MTANASGGPSRSDWRRKRNLRIGTMAGGLVLIMIVITVWPRSGDSGTDELATSSAQSTSTLDTSPFELLPGGGPTTIPNDELTTTTSYVPLPPTTTTTTRPPTTTTTLPPTTTTLPIPPRQSDPICQAFVELIRFARTGLASLDEPDAFAKKVSKRIVVWIRQLKEIDAEKYAQAIQKLEHTLAQLRDSPSADELALIMADLLTPDPRFAPLVAHRDRFCPSVGLAR